MKAHHIRYAFSKSGRGLYLLDGQPLSVDLDRPVFSELDSGRASSITLTLAVAAIDSLEVSEERMSEYVGATEVLLFDSQPSIGRWRSLIGRLVRSRSRSV